LVDGSLESGVDFLLTVIEVLFLSLTTDALQGKTCQNSPLFGGVGQFESRFRGNGSSLGNIFWFLENQTHFAIWQWKLHRATCSRFDTITACDREMDRQTDRRTELL